MKLAELRTKVENGLNRLGRRWGAAPREYINVNGVEVCIRHRDTAADISCIVQCLARKEYEIPGVFGALRDAPDRYYKSVVKSGKTPLIVDAGANIGASALWFATRFPKSTVVAIEPAKDNFELLRVNSQSLNVRTVLGGVGATGGRAALVDGGFGAWAYRTMPSQEKGEVVILTLKDVMSEMSPEELPFILKVDIEGSEADIFDGDDNPAQLFPVIIIELHDWMLPKEGTCRSFLRFHLSNNRDFLSKGENVFSIDFAALEHRISLSG